MSMKFQYRVILLFVPVLLIVKSSFHSVSRDPSSDKNQSSLSPQSFVVDDHLRLFNFNEDKFFYLSNTLVSSKLIIHQYIPGEKSVSVKLVCDNEIQKIKEKIDYNKEISIILPPNIKNCDLEYFGEVSGKKGLVKIVNETLAFPIISELQINRNIGSLGNDESPLPIQKFFTSDKLNNTTGNIEVGDYQTLESPESGFIAKMHALIGYDLDPDFIKNQNPYANIDFSRAPKLDAIFVSTLVYRADFYGTVLTRALKYHAENGALIHIATTGYMMLEKDKKLLEPLASQYGNLRLQEFIYKDTGSVLTRFSRAVNTKYRDMHVKMFVTVSKESPQNNIVIFGGRNIHDGFLFKTKPDHSKYPELVNYGVDEDFVHWNDFEMKLVSAEASENVYAHLLKFWHRDSRTQIMDEAHSVTSGTLEVERSSFRHMISIPYNDGSSLEKFFVQLIDNSSKSIKISSPYLRPTREISKALERATVRGVSVTIQTRINLEGDTQAWLYSEVNKESINRFYKKIKIYEWKENSILHSKFILIDDKVAFIGSVNLSRRSFIQDVENGFLIQSEGVVKKMNTIFDGYLTHSQLIDGHQARKILPSIFIYFFKNQF